MDDRLKTALVIVLVVAIGLFAIKTAFDLYYEAELLKFPCDLCQELNPPLERCFEDASINITDSNTKTYNLTFPSINKTYNLTFPSIGIG